VTYREQAQIYRDVWEWDIVLVNGDVKIIGRTHDHLDNCIQVGEYSCGCSFDTPKLSSPVVDGLGKRLEESAYSGEPTTGEALHLLDAGTGSQIPVLSGKTYRLNGPRTHHSSFTVSSIWNVYAQHVPNSPSFMRLVLTWVGGA